MDFLFFLIVWLVLCWAVAQFAASMGRSESTAFWVSFFLSPVVGIVVVLVKLLLANDADVNAKAGDGSTPVHLAAAGAQRNVVTIPLANKAELNAQSNNGATQASPIRSAEAA